MDLPVASALAGPSAVALVVSSPDSVGVHPDHEIDAVVEALQKVGLETAVVPWTANLDWTRFGVIVLKSPWDYSMRSEDFSDWLSHVESRARVLNDPRIIRWNFDKRYLKDLSAGGLSVTPFDCVLSEQDAESRLAHFGASRVVVKPTVWAGSRNTGLFEANDPAAVHLINKILRLGKTPMITPALDAIEDHGEHGLVFFGGLFSHCGRKAPILALGGGYLGGRYNEVIDLAEPHDDEIELGTRCIQLVADIAVERGVTPRFSIPLYARIDIARDENNLPQILEAEFFEPNYFTRLDPTAPNRFASALLGYCG